ncbi:MAG: pyruvate ferredoxin oxidoreductase, partial [Raoultibacter sp.]
SELVAHCVTVDDAALVEHSGSRKTLNIMLLASALAASDIGISIDDLKRAIPSCVKERFVAMNLEAVDIAIN